MEPQSFPGHERNARSWRIAVVVATLAAVVGVDTVGAWAGEPVPAPPQFYGDASAPGEPDEPTPVEREPVPSEPVEPVPVEPAPVEPTGPTPVEPAEPVPSEPAPAEPGEPSAEQPVEEPPAEEPTAPPTEEPIEPPAQEPTAPPTEEPVEPPTEEPTAPPSPEPPEPPAPRVREAPPAHRTPFAQSRADAVALEAERAALEAISAASVRLEGARAVHAQAEAQLQIAEAHYRLAEAAAERLDERATRSEGLANAIDRLFVSVLRERAFSPDDWALVFEQQNGDLSTLGTAGRLRDLARNAQALGELAADHRERAIAHRSEADVAQAALAALGIERSRAAERSAAQNVEAAERELQTLQAARLAGLNDTVPLARDAGQLSDVGWALPVTGAISGGYGWRPVKPLPGASSFHSGLDVASDCGTPVFAAAAGTVEDAGWAGGYGAMILLDHGSGVQTGYAHLPANGIAVEKGQTVAAGQLIGVVGTTGVSTGCHLHFEVLIDGGRVNPIPFLVARGVNF